MATTTSGLTAGSKITKPWQTYDQFYASNPEAMKLKGYGYGQPETAMGVGQKWTGGQNPYRFRNEYNTYLSALPQLEQTMARRGIRSAAFPTAPIAQSGDTPEQTAARISGGTGSTHSLSPEVLGKMWR